MLTHNNKIGASTVSVALAEPKSEGRGQDAQLWFPLNWNYFASNFVTMSKTNPTGPITVEQGPSVFLGGKGEKKEKVRRRGKKEKCKYFFNMCTYICSWKDILKFTWLKNILYFVKLPLKVNINPWPWVLETWTSGRDQDSQYWGYPESDPNFHGPSVLIFIFQHKSDPKKCVSWSRCIIIMISKCWKLPKKSKKKKNQEKVSFSQEPGPDPHSFWTRIRNTDSYTSLLFLLWMHLFNRAASSTNRGVCSMPLCRGY